MERDRVSGGAPENLQPKRRPSGAPEIPEVLRSPGPVRREAKERQLGSLSQGFALGTDLLVSIAGGIVLGILVDRWLGSSPIGLLVGLGAGMFAAVGRLIRRARSESGGGGGRG